VTCLVALRHARGAVLGVDSAISAGDTRWRAVKLWQRGAVTLAVSGDDGVGIDRMLDSLPRSAHPKDLRVWASRRLGPRIRRSKLTALLVCGRQCVEIDQHGALEVAEYTATGSAFQVATGALHAMRAMGASPRAAVLAALRAAATHDAGVMGPFTLVHAPSGRKEIVR